ncbi:hypothetical protein CI266_002158 [Salmonella enterica subsp. enterica serovar Kotte]|nr:hypothetical protein [Salmonella enterica subsp. enterica serovar Kotte]
MAVFIELRCELRGAGLEGDRRCWSDDNAGPQMLAEDTHRDVHAATCELFASAHHAGWVRWGNGWVCPACAGNAETVIAGGSNGAV